MYTSEDRKNVKKPVIIYMAAVLFCMLFSFVYNMFAHGVHSPYMTWLSAWPLVLGIPVQSVICHIKSCNAGLDGNGPDETRQDKTTLAGKRYNEKIVDAAECIYNSGIAAITAGSMLRGIMDIAGTGSVYQTWMMYAGAGMAVAGAVILATGLLLAKNNI